MTRVASCLPFLCGIGVGACCTFLFVALMTAVGAPCR